jgi:hypothetical protein
MRRSFMNAPLPRSATKSSFMTGLLYDAPATELALPHQRARSRRSWGAR